MITMEPLFPPVSGHASDPVLLGVTRGLAQSLEPLGTDDLPAHLSELVLLLEDGQHEA